MAQLKFLQRCQAEATANVVFLFQRRLWSVVGLPRGHAMDPDGDVFPEGDPDAAPLSYAKLAKMDRPDGGPCAVEKWHTELVFLSREEAEQYGRDKDYNYRHGWRVYGVPACGELAEVLRAT